MCENDKLDFQLPDKFEQRGNATLLCAIAFIIIGVCFSIVPLKIMFEDTIDKCLFALSCLVIITTEVVAAILCMKWLSFINKKNDTEIRHDILIKSINCLRNDEAKGKGSDQAIKELAKIITSARRSLLEE